MEISQEGRESKVEDIKCNQELENSRTFGAASTERSSL